jgi:hypothetical protein
MRRFCRSLGVGVGLLSIVGTGPKLSTDAAVASAYRVDTMARLSPATKAFPPVRETRTAIIRIPPTAARVPIAAKRNAIPDTRPVISAPHPTAQPVTTSCAAVVATVIWPSTWHAICTGPRVGILGLTGPDGITTLYVRPGESSAFLRIVALHEAGHAWDFSHLTSDKIMRWCAARGCSGTGFFAGGATGAGWHEPGGAEDWAASWDACHGGSYHRSYLGLPPPPTSQCALQNALVGYPNG